MRHLATDILEPVNRTSVSPLSVTKVGDFVDRVYLPFTKQQKRPSTDRGYRQPWHQYVKARCEQAWMREVKTHHVQTWLDEIARERRKEGETEYTLSKTTMAHIKNFLSEYFGTPRNKVISMGRTLQSWPRFLHLHQKVRKAAHTVWKKSAKCCEFFLNRLQPLLQLLRTRAFVSGNCEVSRGNPISHHRRTMILSACCT